MTTTLRNLLCGTLTAAGLLFGAAHLAQAQTDTQPPAAFCEDIRYMMARAITPYDLDFGGGTLRPGTPQPSTLAVDAFGDTWSMNVTRTADAATGRITPAELALTFDSINGLALEAGLFRGMEPVLLPDGEAYQPVSTGATYRYTLTVDGVYTLVVRRTQVRAVETAGDYVLRADFTGDAAVARVDPLRDDTLGRPLDVEPVLTAGREVIALTARADDPPAQVVLHPGATYLVASYNGAHRQVYYGTRGNNYYLYLNDWADQITLVGGDLAVSGTVDAVDPTSGGRRRSFYLENFGYAGNNGQDGDLLAFRDALNTRLQLSWDALEGVWITRDCAGFTLAGDDPAATRSFIGQLDPLRREITFRGTGDDFTLTLLAPDRLGSAQTHQMTLSWDGIAAPSETQFYAGVFNIPLLDSRQVSLESTALDLRRDPAAPTAAGQPFLIQLRDQGATLRFDWQALARFAFLRAEAAEPPAYRLELTFQDAPRQFTQRTVTDLLRFEEDAQVIRIVEKPSAEGSPGEERLLLPASEGFIELLTPAGQPAFDGRALPGQPGYFPRALNNTGGECYPVNTLLPEANCPPNGHPNPANGNLWYSITDHLAHGGGPYGGPFDLALTRSYNSAYAAVDGPFGFGWTSLYRLDYDVPYDALANARVIDPSQAERYPVGLNLTWAPRGVVTFTTLSGSQHVFVRRDPAATSGPLTALTMPGWTLDQPTPRDPWTLVQSDGLTFTFDRAGRILSYGYPALNRLVTIAYPRDTLNGLGSLGEDSPILITDQADQRRLELYYDRSHHIVRTILRDLTVPDAPSAACDPAQNCFEAQYRYDEGGRLVAVRYPDGSAADYRYDAANRLTYHSDPRAPVAAEMTYTYEDTGILHRIAVIDPASETPLPWRALAVSIPPDADPSGDPILREVSVEDEYQNTRTYTYRLEDGELRAVGNTFTLITATSPLAALGGFEAVPQQYQWTDGLLDLIGTRQAVSATGGEGRNSIAYVYAGDNLVDIRGGLPTLAITTDASGLLETLATPDDGTSRQYRYEIDPASGQRLLSSFTDTFGAEYTFAWERDGAGRPLWPSTLTRTNDQTVTAYTYNALGLVTRLRRYRVGDDPEAAYAVHYTYDGLGRIVAVEDSLTGSYRIDYPPPADGITALAITDATNAVTLSRFDTRGHLLETCLADSAAGCEADSADFQRRTTYTYDVFGRCITESRWLSPVPGLDPAEAVTEALTTTTSYTPVRELPPLGSPGAGATEADSAPVLINGYQITVTQADPMPRTRRYTYDALDRIRQVEDEFRRIVRFSYSVEEAGIRNPGDNPNGLRITAQEVVGGSIITTRYLFDSRWQLRLVERQTPDDGDDVDDERQRWRFIAQTQADVSLVLTESDGAQINEQRWGSYRQGRPETVRTVQINVPLNSGEVLPVPTLSGAVDFLGRPLQAVDGNGTAYAVRYCPTAGGGERVVYALPASQEAAAAFTCDSAAFALAVTFDAAGRIIQVADSAAEAPHLRDYAYRADPAAQQWVVDVRFTDTAVNTWQVTFDAAGDLLTWRDDSGFTRTYTHDSLGRVRRVAVGEDAPEANLTYRYNSADLVTEALDDLGRGWRYVYNELGQTTVAQDARTGNATIYGYNAVGLLATIISPLGNTTAYLYEDPHDPFRLTGFIGPSGNLTQFTWDDATNTLTYTNQRDTSTRYSFDSFGALWRIDDAPGTPLERSHELIYDAAGQLTAWRQSQPASGGPARFLSLRYEHPQQVFVTDAAGATGWTREFVAAPLGDLLQTSTPGGEPLALTYDALGRLTQAAAGERTWTLNYVDGAAQIDLIDGFGTPTLYQTDALGRLLRQEGTDAEGQTGQTLRAYTYRYSGGAEVTIQAVRDSTRLYVFSAGDSASRQRSVRLRAPGDRVTYTYDANGLLISIVNEACVSTEPAAEIDPDNPDSCTETDSVRRTAERITYDAQGRPLRYIDVEENIATFAYDDTGNLITFQNVAGQTFNYTYDALNRLAVLDGPTGVRLLLRYNALDQLDGLCRSREELARTYAECEARGGVLEVYEYDTLGRLQTQSVPGTAGGTEAVAQDSAIAIDYRYAAEGSLAGWGEVEIMRDPALGLLERVQVAPLLGGGGSYTLTYAALNRLAEIEGTGAQRYVYDRFGRPTAIAGSEQTFLYDYAAENRGYTLVNAATGAGIRTALDSRGYLREMAYLGPGQAARVGFNYTLTTDGRALVVEAAWDGGLEEVVELRLNRRLEGLSAAYELNTLFIDYVTDAVGEVQRLGIAGLQSYFIAPYGGYIILIGYDDDGRPLTMRVNDRTSGGLIYLLTFTYDLFGQRVTETRQYGDIEQSQVTINNTYESGSRLATRTISLSQRRVSEQGVPLLLLLPLAGWAARRPRRRLLLLGLGLGLVLASTWTLSRSSAQQNVLTFVYGYDRQGNIVSVSRTDPASAEAAPVVCARYSYDAANRLVRVERGESFSQTYRYDLRNRVIEIGNQTLHYIADSPALLGAEPVAGGGIQYYGQTADLPGFFQTSEAGITWLLNDGRTQIIAARAGGADAPTSPLWLFDPVGRYLSLDAPLVNDDPCAAGAIPDALVALSPLQILRDDIVWDATTNLYLIDGRVYSPQIGRFLQRDPLGPDAFGNVYGYPTRQTTPPVRPPQVPYRAGLARLADALDAIQAANAQTSAAVQAAQYPALHPTQVEALLPLLDQTAQATRDRLARQLELPVWLAYRYNQFPSYVDAGGRLRSASGANRYAPAQGGRPDGYRPPDIGGAFGLYTPLAGTLPGGAAPGIAAPLTRLQALVAFQSAAPGYYTDYETFAWRPLPVRLSDMWAVEPLRLGLEHTPHAVWAWLPQTLTDPQTALPALEAVQAMIALPTTTHQDWLERALALALPQPPELPAPNGSALLETFFRYDPLGIATTLAQRWPQPPALDVPVYGLGLSEEWPRLR